MRITRQAGTWTGRADKHGVFHIPHDLDENFTMWQTNVIGRHSKTKHVCWRYPKTLGLQFYWEPWFGHTLYPRHVRGKITVEWQAQV